MKMSRPVTVLPALMCLCCGLSSSAHGATLVFEPFTHPDGPLVGQSPQRGAAWAAHSGEGNKPIQVSSGEISLEQSGGSGEDVNSAFAAQSDTATTYARFDFQLPNGNDENSDIENVDGSGNYFAHFKDSGFAFRARTGVVAASAGGDFGLAINADSSNLGEGATWPSDLSFDTTYRVVISWNAETGESRLWLNPETRLSPSISHTGGNTGDLMEAFAFRQSNDYDGLQFIDNLAVATSFIPEPTALLLMLVGLLATTSCARRR